MTAIELDTTGLADVQFGKDILRKEFCLRAESGFLNHGSYGTVPRRILDLQKRYLDEMESHPDHWFRRLAQNKWDESRQVVAEFIGADVQDVVFVVNATSGVNTVLRSMKFEAGDAIMGSSLTYGAMKNLWKDMAEKICPKGVEALLMDIQLPIASEEDLIQQYDAFLTEHPNVKFVLIDHITSPSAVLMPVKRLAEVCHQHSAMVMVDGAHAPGQVHLNLRELGVDFYTGNLHKWMYNPRGCAVLWVRREHQSLLSPPNTSWKRGKSLSEQFFDQGTRDHIPFVCAKHALHFYKAIGGMDRIVGYTSGLITRVRDMLSQEIGLQRMDVPMSMESPNIRLLKLPGVPAFCAGLDPETVAWTLQDKIYREHDTQIIFDWADKALYLRICVQIHTTLEDFHRLVPIVKTLIAGCVPFDKYFASCEK